MDQTLDIIKGIHPGIFLDRELKKRKITPSRFAMSIEEHPQTLNAITKGKRGITASLSYRLGKALGYEEAFFLILQAYFEMETERKRRKALQQTPDLAIFRPAIFWDTDIKKLDWAHQKKAIITRVFERGNEQEKSALIDFYGWDTIRQFTEVK